MAVIKGETWTLAQVIRNKTKLKVIKLSQFSMENLEERQALQENSSSHNDSELTIGSSHPEPMVKLKEWLKQQKVPLKKLKLAFSCPGIITRIITLPKMSTKDLDKLLTEQVSQYFTFNIADYLVDYRIVDIFEEEGQKRQRILLAALPMFQWKQFCSNMDILGLKPTIIDLTADSLARLYGKLHNLEKSLMKVSDFNDKGLDIAIVDLGAERVEFIILEDGLFFLYSDQEVALEDLNNMKLSISTPLDGNKPLEGEDTLVSAYKELEDALTPVLRTLGEFITFFAARHFGKTIDKIFLTGELSDIPLITELFKTSLEVDTQLGFPGNWKPTFIRKAQKDQEDWMKYGSLYGLAMRED